MEGSLPLDATSILAQAQKLTAPQDLRFAIFALKTQQTSANILLTHISELKKVCIVRQIDSHRISLTLCNGLTAAIQVHYSYPEVNIYQ